MRTADIAKRYLTYFQKHGHLVMPSGSLISPNPTTLFTIAGMVPFIPYLLGEQVGILGGATPIGQGLQDRPQIPDGNLFAK